MKKILFFLSGACLVWAVLFFILLPSIGNQQTATQEPDFSNHKKIRYEFTVRNDTNQLLENVNVWIHGPVKRTASQICREITTSHPYQLKKDRYGNQVLNFMFEKLPPYATRIISITAHIALSEAPEKLPHQDTDIFLLPEKYIESEHPAIISKSEVLNSGSRYPAETIHQWVSNHMTYSGYSASNRGALYAFTQKKGDCTEYMDLFIALCRAAKIPARGVGGYICTKDMVLKPGDYHNWAEFFHKGRWYIADPQNKIFKAKGSDYIAMRIMLNTEKQNVPEFNRFWTESKGVNIKMNS